MANYNIIFDIEKNLECLYYNSLTHEELLHNNFHLWDKCTPKPIGTFLLDFMNTQFEKENMFNRFVLKYCFADLFSRYVVESQVDTKKYYDNDNYLSIKEKDLPPLLKKLYKSFSDDLVYNRDLFIRITTKVIFTEEDEKELQMLSKFKSEEEKKNSEEEIYNELKENLSSLFSYDNDLKSLSSEIEDLRLDFTMDDFFIYTSDNTLSKTIPYSFKSNDYLCILFISFKQLINSNKCFIKKCANCNNFFIPKTLRDTKYCDRIFKGNKTCKQIGRDISYKENLAKDPLLKAYRSRYQTLSKQASERDHLEMYEYFKKEGPSMRKKFVNAEITAEQFQDWIDSTKVRKK